MTPLLAALAGDAEVEALFTGAADVAAMLRFEAALAGAQAGAGVIPHEHADAIARACASFTPDWPELCADMARDGVAIPGLLRQVRRLLGAEAAASLHKGATSQDAIDTSLVLRLAELLDILDVRLALLGDALASLAARDGALPIMAQTRMQQALPFTVADKVAAWLQPLLRHRARLAQLRPRLLLVQLGGPVGDRASLGPQAADIAADLAQRLGLAAAPAWHAQRDAIAELGGWLALVCGSLGKFGQDLALMSQNGIAAVRLAGGGGSSAMAHKHNPVRAEVLVALARYAAGLSGTLAQAMVHENERSGAAWTLEWLTLPPLATAAAASLRLALALTSDLTFLQTARA